MCFEEFSELCSNLREFQYALFPLPRQELAPLDNKIISLATQSLDTSFSNFEVQLYFFIHIKIASFARGGWQHYTLPVETAL